MKLTLLELVQDMLSAIDAELATSVGDHPEAAMCVNIANRAYESMIIQVRWKHLQQYSQLITTTALNEMLTPTGSIAVDPNNVYYSDVPVFWMEPEHFLAMTIRRDTAESNIQAINNIKVYNDRDPLYFTSDDDETLIFDAIPNSVDGLAGTDTTCICIIAPSSRLTDDGEVFDLPSAAFTALSSLCISMAIGELKGDTRGGQAELREYKKKMGVLSVNSRLVIPPKDIRDWIVPRRGRNIIQTRII